MQAPQSKAEWRAALRGARRNRTPDQNDGTAIAEHVMDLEPIRDACAAGRPIACYASRPEEPPTGELRQALREAGAIVLLPRVNGEELVWSVDDPTVAMNTNAWNIAEPVGEATDLEPAAWLIPGLAIDSDGYRLGQGGGFYDRALQDLPHDGRGPIIAVVFEEEIVPQLPREQHDLPVEIAVTPQRVRWLAMPD